MSSYSYILKDQILGTKYSGNKKVKSGLRLKTVDTCTDGRLWSIYCDERQKALLELINRGDSSEGEDSDRQENRRAENEPTPLFNTLANSDLLKEDQSPAGAPLVAPSSSSIAGNSGQTDIANDEILCECELPTPKLNQAELEEKLRRLQKEQETLYKKSDECFDAIEVLRNEKKELKNEIDELKNENEELKKENKDLYNEKDALQNDKKLLGGRLSELSDTISQRNSDLELERRKSEQFENENAELQTRMSQMKNMEEELEKVLIRTDSLSAQSEEAFRKSQDQINELQSTIKDVVGDRDLLMQENKKLSDELVKERRSIHELKCIVSDNEDEMKTVLNHLEHHISRSSTFDEEKHVWDEKEKELLSEIKDRDLQLRAYEKQMEEVQEMEVELEALKTQLAAFMNCGPDTGRMKELEEEICLLKQQLFELPNIEAELEDARLRFCQMESLLSRYKAKYGDVDWQDVKIADVHSMSPSIKEDKDTANIGLKSLSKDSSTDNEDRSSGSSPEESRTGSQGELSRSVSGGESKRSSITRQSGKTGLTIGSDEEWQQSDKSSEEMSDIRSMSKSRASEKSTSKSFEERTQKSPSWDAESSHEDFTESEGSYSREMSDRGSLGTMGGIGRGSGSRASSLLDDDLRRSDKSFKWDAESSKEDDQSEEEISNEMSDRSSMGTVGRGSGTSTSKSFEDYNQKSDESGKVAEEQERSESIRSKGSLKSTGEMKPQDIASEKSKSSRSFSDDNSDTASIPSFEEKEFGIESDEGRKSGPNRFSGLATLEEFHEDEIEDYKKTIDELEKKIEGLNNELFELKSFVDGLKKDTEKINDLSEEDKNQLLKQLEIKVGFLEKEISDLKNKNDENEKEHNELLENAMLKNKLLEDELDDIRSSDVKNTLIKELESKISTLEEAKDENVEDNKIAELLEDVDRKNKLIEELQSQIKDLEDEEINSDLVNYDDDEKIALINTLQSKIEELEKELNTLRSPTDVIRSKSETPSSTDEEENKSPIIKEQDNISDKVKDIKKEIVDGEVNEVPALKAEIESLYERLAALQKEKDEIEKLKEGELELWKKKNEELESELNKLKKEMKGMKLSTVPRDAFDDALKRVSKDFENKNSEAKQKQNDLNEKLIDEYKKKIEALQIESKASMKALQEKISDNMKGTEDADALKKSIKGLKKKYQNLKNLYDNLLTEKKAGCDKCEVLGLANYDTSVKPIRVDRLLVTALAHVKAKLGFNELAEVHHEVVGGLQGYLLGDGNVDLDADLPAMSPSPVADLDNEGRIRLMEKIAALQEGVAKRQKIKKEKVNRIEYEARIEKDRIEKLKSQQDEAQAVKRSSSSAPFQKKPEKRPITPKKKGRN